MNEKEEKIIGCKADIVKVKCVLFMKTYELC